MKIFSRMAAIGFALLAASAAAHADNWMVYRLDGTMVGQGMMGKKSLILIVEPPAGNGKQMRFAVPNNAPMGGYDPSSAVTGVLKDAKKGDLIELAITPMMGTMSVSGIGHYDAKEGEDTPRGFIFEELKESDNSNGSQTRVVLGKYRQSTQVLIPSKTEGGQSSPDAEMLDAVGKLKKGDVVEVEVDATAPGAPVLKYIIPYKPPEKGTFAKLTKIEKDGLSQDAVEITADGKAISALLPGAEKQMKKGKDTLRVWTPEARYMTMTKKLKAGQAVVNEVREQGGATWLIDILADESVKNVSKAGGDVNAKNVDAKERGTAKGD